MVRRGVRDISRHGERADGHDRDGPASTHSGRFSEARAIAVARPTPSPARPRASDRPRCRAASAIARAAPGAVALGPQERPVAKLPRRGSNSTQAAACVDFRGIRGSAMYSPSLRRFWPTRLGAAQDFSIYRLHVLMSFRSRADMARRATQDTAGMAMPAGSRKNRPDAVNGICEDLYRRPRRAGIGGRSQAGGEAEAKAFKQRNAAASLPCIDGAALGGAIRSL